MNWPANPFWDYALELYRRQGVEVACLELPQRHGLDVNIVLFCCWLAERARVADEAFLARIAKAAETWQNDVVQPLRAIRSRLKSALTARQQGSIAARWPELAGALRERILALEIDGERLEQLLLAMTVASVAAQGCPMPVAPRRTARACLRAGEVQ